MEIALNKLPEVLKVKIRVQEECWIWIGAKNNGGYPLVRVLGELWSVSKLIHTLFISPVRSDYDTSHICSNRDCCRPHSEHVIFETHQKNMERNQLQNSLRCRKNHDLSGDNLVIKGGIYRCNLCYNAASRARKKKKRGPLRYTS